MKLLNAFVLVVAVALVASWSVFAQPPGKGGGAGPGGMPDDFRDVIHALFADHGKVDRSVELTKDGYRSRATSADAGIAKLLQKHVAQMGDRLDEGYGVRHWDPAFAELRAYYDDLEVKVENVEGGIAVEVFGKTPEAVKVAQNHAKIVGGFVEKGEKQMHAEHPAVLTETTTTEAAASVTGEVCEKCSGKNQAAGTMCGDKNCGKGDKPCCAGRRAEAAASSSDS
ncbi:MAG: hypothetical protein KDN19_21945 [Verrucomicrobiae bacterium]|nr:hypothetical protein [Verrucomicrobiae bacterium]